MMQKSSAALNASAIDGLVKPDSAAARAALGVQSARLQGEVAAMGESLSRLPPATLETLRATRFAALTAHVSGGGGVRFVSSLTPHLAQLKEPMTLRALTVRPEALFVAVRVLDAYGALRDTVRHLFKQLLHSFPDPVHLIRVLTTREAVASVSVTASAAVLLARPLLKKCVGAFMLDVVRLHAKVLLDEERGQGAPRSQGRGAREVRSLTRHGQGRCTSRTSIWPPCAAASSRPW